MKTLGIIGCGAVIENSYFKALGIYRDIAVKYVHDLNETNALKIAKLFNAKATDKNEVIAKSDILVIATPPSTHFSILKDCIKPGKRVICEKPFVSTYNECEEVVRLAQDSNCKLFVAHFRRCFPSVQLGKQIVASGLLGEIKSIELFEGGRFSWQTQSGYVFKDPFGGVLYDTGSHTIDMALYMAELDQVNLIPEVVGIKKDKDEPAHEVDARLILNNGNSKIDFRSKFSRRILLSNKVRVTGSNGYIDVPTGMTNYIRLGGKKSSQVIYTNKNYEDIMDSFAVQFDHMFNDKPESIFEASRFGNQTRILELIANSK